MKKRATAIFSALAVTAILATAASTPAQSNYGMRITVPFDFAIGDKTYPSGSYAVGVSPNNLDLIRVRATDNNTTAFVTSTVPLEAAGGEHQSQLEFNRYGDRYFLHKIWLGAQGHKLPKSKLERALIEDRSEGAGGPEIETAIVTPN